MRRLIPFVLMLALAGCGESDGYVVLHADGGWPTETLRDWVSYGDQLSVIAILDESEPARWPEYKDSGGLLGRRVTARVERTLWRRPGAPPEPPRTIRFDAWGWMMGSDQHPSSSRRRVVGEHEPRLEVGRRYLAVLTRARGEWFPVGVATMTVDGDGIVTSEVVAQGPVPGAAALRGLSLEEAARTLARTRPYPRAVQYGHLPPAQRWRRVARVD